MKNSLEFSHFRRFENFPSIDFGEITFLVGKNNSGKSTFVKTILMVLNFLKSRKVGTFNFNEKGVENLNIVTFDRALCKTMENREEKDKIDIRLKLGDFEFYLIISGGKDDVEVSVHEIQIIDHKLNISFKISPQNQEIEIKKKLQSIRKVTNAVDSLRNEIISLEDALKNISEQFSKEYIEINTKLNKVRRTLSIEHNKLSIQDVSFAVSTYYTSSDLFDVLDSAYSTLMTFYSTINSEGQNILNDDDQSNVNSESEDEESINNIYSLENENAGIVEDLSDVNLRYFYQNRNLVLKSIDRIKYFIQTSELIYLPATINKQSALFSIRDEKNALAQTIHQYSQVKVKNESSINLFVNKWLKLLEIGESLAIKMISGEAYSVMIKTDGVDIPLADKGMGSIQAILLILRIANILKKFVDDDSKLFGPDSETEPIFVIIEEPELNLHPALQSLLCEMFFEIHLLYKIKFIIETHSEYLVRKSQVITAQTYYDNKNVLPFSTIYFPTEKKEPVYSMNYNTDGSFERKFGEGFFDASFKTTAELFKIKKNKEQNL